MTERPNAEEIVEAVARALCGVNFLKDGPDDPDDGWDMCPEKIRERYREEAREAIAAARPLILGEAMDAEEVARNPLHFALAQGMQPVCGINEYWRKPGEPERFVRSTERADQVGCFQCRAILEREQRDC